ncbi:MAG: DUF370 domain-containing protein [Oscillospiraceae bacterium]|jgi:hypothetical protein|nr:DUF370 domain-containing protein [Oscillospiraceae bacterium]
MYIHIGGDYVVSDRLVLCIVDLDQVHPHQTDMKRFMIAQEESGRMEYIGKDIPQSLIVTMDRTYVSPLSTQTLLQRTVRNTLETREKHKNGHVTMLQTPIDQQNLLKGHKRRKVDPHR